MVQTFPEHPTRSEFSSRVTSEKSTVCRCDTTFSLSCWLDVTFGALPKVDLYLLIHNIVKRKLFSKNILFVIIVTDIVGYLVQSLVLW